jgi:plastocyanin
MRLLAPLLLALLTAAPALAADLMVTVRDQGGRPAQDAVVMVHPGGRAATPGFRLAGAPRMVQRNVAFEPFVLVVPVGQDVTFPNLDKVRHHVYSFSPGAKFELKLFGREETRTHRFDKPGVAALGCNIHDQMIAFIKIVDTPYAVKTDASGQAVLKGVPAGAVVVRVWHPYQRGKADAVLPIKALPEGATRQTATLDLRPAR